MHCMWMMLLNIDIIMTMSSSIDQGDVAQTQETYQMDILFINGFPFIF